MKKITTRTTLKYWNKTDILERINKDYATTNKLHDGCGLRPENVQKLIGDILAHNIVQTTANPEYKGICFQYVRGVLWLNDTNFRQR